MDISIVIPCHNGQPYLAQAIGSALAQTRPPAEVIVIDDSSTDDSATVAASFGGAVRLESRSFGSAARTRNYGASLAGGDALMFLDADDVLGPDSLEALANQLEQHPRSVVACPWFRLERVRGAWVRRPPSCAPKNGRDPLDAWLTGWYHPPCSVLWSRGALEQAGEWDPRAGPNDDGDLMMRALVVGVPLRLTSRGESFYRRLPDGATSLSGTRFTEKGLRSRIFVVTRIAQMLDERQRLDDHRKAIGHALSIILRDCRGEHPKLEQECRFLRNRLGEPRWRRIGRTLLRRVRAHTISRLRRTNFSSQDPSGDSTELEEIRFGLPTE